MAILLISCGVGCLWLWRERIAYRSASTLDRPDLGNPDLRADATQLKRTVVVPMLDYPIAPGTNILWCATLQLAWDELCQLVGEDIQMEPESVFAAALNKKTVSRKDVDEATYVAVAGVADPTFVRELRERLQDKFGGAFVPELVPSPDNVLCAYGCLFVNLPFKWAFERLSFPLDFGGTQVSCFGIRQYMRTQENERLAATQIRIYDARGKDDFIVELKTRRGDHHLWLAKVPPLSTLSATIQSVQQRIATSQPDDLEMEKDLMVPLLDFDIQRDYPELTGNLLPPRPRRFGTLQSMD